MSQPPRNLSKYQFGLLNYVRTHKVTLEELRTVHASTLGPVLEHRWVARTGNTDSSHLILTPDGEAAVNEYRDMGLRRRMHTAPLTDRCAVALRTANASRIFRVHTKAG